MNHFLAMNVEEWVKTQFKGLISVEVIEEDEGCMVVLY